MAIRDVLRRLLSGGNPSADDPDEFVELTVVPLMQGPLVMSALDAAGVPARGSETFNVATSTTANYRVLVPRGRRADAEAVLADVS